MYSEALVGVASRVVLKQLPLATTVLTNITVSCHSVVLVTGVSHPPHMRVCSAVRVYRGLSKTTVKRKNAVLSLPEWQSLCSNRETCHQGVVK